MKWTSRLSLSSLATMIGALCCLALERLGELRPTVECVAPLAGLDLAEGFDQLEPFGLGEAGERGLLRLEAKARSTLAGGRNAGVGDGGLHGFGPSASHCDGGRYVVQRPSQVKQACDGLRLRVLHR